MFRFIAGSLHRNRVVTLKSREISAAAWGLESRSRRYKQNGPRGSRSLRYINQLSHPYHSETAFYGKPSYQKATSACISIAGQPTRQFDRESFYY